MHLLMTEFHLPEVDPVWLTGFKNMIADQLTHSPCRTVGVLQENFPLTGW